MARPVDPTLKFGLTKIGEQLKSTSPILDVLSTELTAPQVAQTTGQSQEEVDKQLRDFFNAKVIKVVK